MILHILGFQIGERYHAVAHSLRCGRGSRSRHWSPLPQPRMGSRIQHTGRQKQLIVLMGNDHHDFTKICDFHFQLPLHSTGRNTGNNMLLHP